MNIFDIILAIVDYAACSVCPGIFYYSINNRHPFNLISSYAPKPQTAEKNAAADSSYQQTKGKTQK